MLGCYGPLTPAQLADLLATGQYSLVGGPYATEAECSAACQQSGSGSGSGGSGSGIDEGCPCDPLPLTLMMTFAASGTCAAWNGVVVPLNYNALSGNWIASILSPVDGSTPILFEFQCVNPPGEYRLSIFVSGHFQLQILLTVLDCSPLQLAFTSDPSWAPAWGCNGPIAIAITD